MPKKLTPEPGVLLLAAPMMHDPNFHRTVVLLCEHTTEGSFGLILNRPLGIQLAEVVKGVGIQPIQLLQGGPVQTDTLHFLHTCGDLIPGTMRIDEGIYWGGDFDRMRFLLGSEKLSRQDVRFFLGYAGWSAGQLDHEAEEGGWIVAPGSGQAVFGMDPSDLWRSVLRGMGSQYAVLANFPVDPRLN